MKKIYSLFFILASLISSAQITLTYSAHGAFPGSISSAYVADTGAYTPGPAGASQIWDFSNLTINNQVYTGNYVDPSTTPYSGTFPGSTSAVSDNTGNFEYYTQTNTELKLNGNSDGTTTVIYSDPEVLRKFPFAYGNTNVDNFAATYSVWTRTGTMEINADAYGTLILRSGSYPALRVKTTENYSDVYAPYQFDANVVIYNWYISTERFPVLEYITTTISGSASAYSKSIIVNADIVGINEQANNDLFMNVYPNPAIDICNLNYALKESGLVSISVMDVLGKVHVNINKGIQSAGDHSETLDLSSIAPGMYIIKVDCGNSSSFKKVQVN
jgi:hypothetical protein